ncbi:MAG: TonB family protein [Robiginitomaculum sp.]|nr:TonB family protein [Robiginitomaculum sp.]
MQENGIDMDDETQAGAKSTLVFAVLATVVLIAVAPFFMDRDNPQDMVIKLETPRQAYLKIIGETHTGIRLARLNDFAVNIAFNENTKAARVRRDALSANEQIAWAKLTDALYNLDKSATDKSNAFAAYKDRWGVWTRQDETPKLLEQTSTIPGVSAQMKYAPNARKSKFATDNTEAMLAGATSAMDALTPIISEHMETKTYETVEPRIKYAKRPRYPRRARRKGIEAVITLSLDIDERGNVARTHVVSINAPRYKDKFIRAARRAAMASKFHPKTITGKPVASRGYLRKYSFTSGG